MATNFLYNQYCTIFRTTYDIILARWIVEGVPQLEVFSNCVPDVLPHRFSHIQDKISKVFSQEVRHYFDVYINLYCLIFLLLYIVNALGNCLIIDVPCFVTKIEIMRLLPLKLHDGVT